MTRTPSRHIGLERLRIIATENHGMSVAGVEYSEEELAARIMALATKKADFDFNAVSTRRAVSERKRKGPRQSTRMRKAACPDSGYLVRLTRTWIEAHGAPICPCCNVPMEIEA